MIIDKYFTTNINIHYMIKNWNVTTFLNQELHHYNAHFSTYNKASISLKLEDISCYLQGRYIESSYYLSQI